MEDRKPTEKEKQALVKKIISHVGKPSFVGMLDDTDSEIIDAVFLEALLRVYDTIDAAMHYNFVGPEADEYNKYFNVLNELIDRVSSEGVDRALVLQERAPIKHTEPRSGFQIVHSCLLLDKNLFSKLINKASREGIDRALLLDHDWFTSLHWVAEQPLLNFHAVIDKASPDVINQVLASGPTYLTLFGIWLVAKETCLYWVAERQDEESFKKLIDQVSLYSICTAMLKSPFTEDNIKKILGANRKILQDKVPAIFFDIQKDLPLAMRDSEAFIEFHKQIFNDELNIKNMTLTGCHVWLKFLNDALPYASTENVRDQIRASCMQLNWIAAGKEKNKKEQEKFQNKAIEYANEIISPEGLSINDNRLIFDFYQRQEKHMSVAGLRFLHQAVLDLKKSNNPAHLDLYLQLRSRVHSILHLELKEEMDREDWTEEDEKKYNVAVYYLQAKKYMDGIEKVINLIENEGMLLDQKEGEIFNQLKHEVHQVKKVIEQKNEDAIVAVLEDFHEERLPEKIKALQKKIYYLKAENYFTEIARRVDFIEDKKGQAERSNFKKFLAREVEAAREAIKIADSAADIANIYHSPLKMRKLLQ